MSVGGFSAADYAETCAALDDVTIELNLSCPNVDEAPESAAEIVAACRAATELPLYAKLSPAAWDIAEVARAVEAAGADGLSLVNTLRGLALDARPAAEARARERRLLGTGAEARRARRRATPAARRRTSRSSGWAASPPGGTCSSWSPAARRTSRSGPCCSPTRTPPRACAASLP